MERDAVVDALPREEGERVGRLRGPVRVQGDLEVAAARLHDRGQPIAPLHRLLRSIEIDALRFRPVNRLATLHGSLGGLGVVVGAAAPDQHRGNRRNGDQSEDPEHDQAAVRGSLVGSLAVHGPVSLAS